MTDARLRESLHTAREFVGVAPGPAAGIKALNDSLSRLAAVARSLDAKQRADEATSLVSERLPDADLPCPRQPFLEQTFDERRQSRAVELVAEFADRFGLRGIRVNGAADLFQAEAVRQGQRDFGNQIARVRRDNRGSHDAISPFPRLDFDEAFRLASQDGSVDVGEVLDVGVEFDALFFRVLLGQPDVSDFGRRVGTPRDRQRAGFGSAEKQRVLNDDASHEIGGVREFVFRADVARREDMRVRRLQSVVDADAGLGIELDAGRFQSEIFDIRSAADGDQQLVHRLVVLPAVRFDRQADLLVVVTQFQFLAAAQQPHSIALQRLADDFRSVAVFQRQDSVSDFNE